LERDNPVNATLTKEDFEKAREALRKANIPGPWVFWNNGWIETDVRLGKWSNGSFAPNGRLAGWCQGFWYSGAVPQPSKVASETDRGLRGFEGVSVSMIEIMFYCGMFLIGFCTGCLFTMFLLQWLNGYFLLDGLIGYG
jgi:hypothetical protein